MIHSYQNYGLICKRLKLLLYRQLRILKNGLVIPLHHKSILSEYLWFYGVRRTLNV